MYQKISILIIEDERSICDFISKTLNSHEYKVTTANNGKDGLALNHFSTSGSGAFRFGTSGCGRTGYYQENKRMVQPADHRDFGQNAGERKSFSSGRRC